MPRPSLPEPFVMVMAKEPVPGRVKTRLQVAYSPDDAAAIAAAALADTLAAVRACGAARRIVALDGRSGEWLGDGFEVIPQISGPFGDRLAAAWATAGAPGLQIGMDTPQVTPALLDECLAPVLAADGPDAVLGLAPDGGWWALGLRRPTPGVFDGVPMSVDDTGARQLARLRELGLRTELLPELSDIDHPADVAALARSHPHLATARLALSLDATPAP